MRKNTVPATPNIQVIERMFTLIDVLASREESMSLKEISERTGLHPSTTHRILNDLAVGRFVDRPEAGSYRLGMRLLELGNLVKDRLNVRDVALQPMRELHKLIQQPVNVSVRACVLVRVRDIQLHVLELRPRLCVCAHRACVRNLRRHAPRAWYSSFLTLMQRAYYHRNKNNKNNNNNNHHHNNNNKQQTLTTTTTATTATTTTTTTTNSMLSTLLVRQSGFVRPHWRCQ